MTCIVDRVAHALLVRAMCAAIERAVRLDPMSDDLATAVLAHRRERMNRALEAVEGMAMSGGDDLEGQVIVVAANLTRHVLLAS